LREIDDLLIRALRDSIAQSPVQLVQRRTIALAADFEHDRLVIRPAPDAGAAARSFAGETRG
jgi:hypothetical protein